MITKAETNLIDAFVLRTAQSNMGIYPMSIRNADGSETVRTPFQDGWNAAILCFSGLAADIRRWVESLFYSSEDFRLFFPTLLRMVDSGSLFFEVSDKETVSEKEPRFRFAVNCNDFFAYACADSVDIPESDLGYIIDLYRRFGPDGPLAWAAAREKVTPIPECLTDRYREATEYVSRSSKSS